MFPFKKYPVKVTIFEKRGSGRPIIIHDKASRIQKRTGEIYYQLKKKKTKTPPVSYGHIYMVRDGRKLRQKVYLYSTTPYTFTPIKLNEAFAQALESGELSTEEIEKDLLPEMIKQNNPHGYDIQLKASDKWLFWASQQLKQNVYRTQYKSTLEKILPIAMVATTGIVVGLMLYMTIGQMQTIAQAFGSATQSMVEVAQSLENVARVMTNTPAPVSPPF